MNDVLSVHVTHEWADMSRLELYSTKQADAFLETLRSSGSVRECALLKTCNRVEVYVVANDPERAREELKSLMLGSDEGKDIGDIRFLSSMDSVRHLARVASGLDSMIVGESQVLSQVKEAYEVGLKAGTIGQTLGEIFRKAISIGKKVRGDTGVGKGCVSIGTAAVDLANRRLTSLEGRTILIVGAGEVSRLVAKALTKEKANKVFIANRTYRAACELANELGSTAVHFDRLNECLFQSDVVICCTAAPHLIMDKEDMEKAFGSNGPSRPLLFIDISNPRNVNQDVRDLPNVSLCDLDGLRDIARTNAERRKEEAMRAETIIETEMKLIQSRYDERRMSHNVVRKLHATAAEIRGAEYAKAMQKLGGLSERDRNVIHKMTVSLTKKILADATESLKAASSAGDEELIRAAERLFKLRKSTELADIPIFDEFPRSGSTSEHRIAELGTRDQERNDRKTTENIKEINGCMTR